MLYYTLYFCLIVVLVIVSVFIVSSSLNGINGEWTNSDDVDTPTKSKHSKEDKVLRNKFFKLNPDLGKKGEKTPLLLKSKPLVVVSKVSANKKPIPLHIKGPLPPPVVMEIPVLPGPLLKPDIEKSVIVVAKLPAEVKKSTVTQSSKSLHPKAPVKVLTDSLKKKKPASIEPKKSRRDNVSDLNLIVKSAPEASEPRVENEVLVIPPIPTKYFELLDMGGFFIKGKICQFVHSFPDMVFDDCGFAQGDYVTIPWCQQFGRLIPGGLLYINTIMYKFLVDKIGIIPDEVRNYSAVSTSIRMMFRDFPRFVLDGLFSHFCFRNSLKATTGTCMLLAYNTNQPYCTGLLTVVPTTISVDVEYCYNSSFAFKQCKGFVFQVEPYGKVCIYPAFNTIKPITVTNANLRSYFRFQPYTSFEWYAKCSQNVGSALSRYFKCRSPINPITGYPTVCEHTMYQNQMKLLTGMPMETIEHSATVCGAVVYDSVQTHSMTLKLRAGYKCDGSDNYRAKYKLDAGNGNYIHLLNQLSTLTYLSWLWIKFCDLYDGLSYLLISYIFTPLWHVYDYVDILKHFVRIPHPKSKLYSNYISDPNKLANIIENRPKFEAGYKLEFGKPGKVGRLFATVAEGTLANVVAAPILKYAFHQEVRLSEVVDKQLNLGYKAFGYQTINFIAIFADCQEAKSSDDLFRRASSCPLNTAYYIYMSDDGFLIINIGGIIFIFETDISSCDSSNKFPIFTAAKYLADKSGCGKGIDILLAQCAGSVTVRNPDCRSELVELLPTCYMEYSGTRITTVLNNLASVAVALGIAEEYANLDYEVDDHVNTIIKGASRYGYIISCAERRSWNSVSFLKRSFNGTVSWVNYGTILRSFGTVHGTPTAECFTGMSHATFLKTSPCELVLILIKMTLDGLVNEPPSLLTNALRSRLDLPLQTETLSRDDLKERYGGEDFEWAALYDALASIKFGDVIRLTILENIFNTDYGTKVTDLDLAGFLEVSRETTLDDIIY